jgi:HAD superfamily hydrolase (TIGR01549 family)
MAKATGNLGCGPCGPEAVVFDAFGTLISFGGVRLNPYRHFLPSSSLELSERRPFLTRDAAPEVFARERGLEHLLPIFDQELRLELDALALFPEVLTVLRVLKERKVRVAVCSNLAKPYGAAVRSLLPQVECFVFSYEVGFAKPESEIYQALCCALAIQPPKVLVIGDSPRCDVDGPAGFGMQSALLDRRAGNTLSDVLDRQLP